MSRSCISRDRRAVVVATRTTSPPCRPYRGVQVVSTIDGLPPSRGSPWVFNITPILGRCPRTQLVCPIPPETLLVLASFPPHRARVSQVFFATKALGLPLTPRHMLCVFTATKVEKRPPPFQTFQFWRARSEKTPGQPNRHRTPTRSDKGNEMALFGQATRAATALLQTQVRIGTPTHRSTSRSVAKTRSGLPSIIAAMLSGLSLASAATATR